jgi:hypothetical protein
MKRRKSRLLVVACLMLIMASGVGGLLYTAHLDGVKVNSENEELRHQQNTECPEEYREFCDQSGFKWSEKYQSAYRKGHIKEYWLTDSVQGRYMKTLLILRPGGFTDHEKQKAADQWNKVREDYGVKAKEIEESTGINKHVGK